MLQVLFRVDEMVQLGNSQTRHRVAGTLFQRGKEEAIDLLAFWWPWWCFAGATGGKGDGAEATRGEERR